MTLDKRSNITIESGREDEKMDNCDEERQVEEDGERESMMYV